MLTKVRLNEEDHSYWINYKGVDRQVPGVTEILTDNGIINYDNIPEHLLAMGHDRGTAVHKAIQYFDNGQLDIFYLDKEIEGYLRGWIKFKKDYDIRILNQELIVYSERFNFAGKLDKLIKINKGINSGLFVADIKTGEIESYVKLQLAGYDIALNETFKRDSLRTKTRGRVAIKLSKDGRYKARFFDEPIDLVYFKSFCYATRFRRENKLKGWGHNGDH